MNPKRFHRDSFLAECTARLESNCPRVMLRFLPELNCRHPSGDPNWPSVGLLIPSVPPSRRNRPCIKVEVDQLPKGELPGAGCFFAYRTAPPFSYFSVTL